MDVAQLSQVLEATVSPDTSQLQLAQQHLEQAASANLVAVYTHSPPSHKPLHTHSPSHTPLHVVISL